MRIEYDDKIKDYVCYGEPPVWVVKSVEPLENYSLRLTFADGKKGVYNALPLLEKSIYAQLKDLRFFMKAKTDGCTVIWSDEIDIAPEHLYEASEPEM